MSEHASELQELKLLLHNIRQHVAQKNLSQLHSCILQAHSLWMPCSEWTRHLVHIFAMLTDAELGAPSFMRRGSVFGVFKLAVMLRVMEGESMEPPVGFVKQVKWMLRMVHDVFQDTASRRIIDDETFLSLNRTMGRFLSSLMGYSTLQNPENNLPEDKKQVLQSIFPIPGKSNPGQSLEFIFPDLLLWYQFFLVMKNHLHCLYSSPSKQIIFLSNLRREVEQVKEPILRWLSLYNFLEQASGSLQQYGSELEELCLQESLYLIKNSKQVYSKYLDLAQSKGIEEISENIFKCMLRFDCVYLTFCLIHKLGLMGSNPLLPVLCEQTNRLISILLPRCDHQLKLLRPDICEKSYYQKLVKFRIQLLFFGRQLTRYALRQTKNESVDILHEAESSRVFYTLPGVFQNDIQELHRRQVWQDKVAPLLQLFNKRFTTLAETQGPGYLSFAQMRHKTHIVEDVMLAQLLITYSCGEFEQLVLSRMGPLETLKFCISLITEFHFNHKQLLMLCVELCCRNLQQSIEEGTQRQVQASLAMCLKMQYLFADPLVGQSQAHYVCSLCGSIQRAWQCRGCFRECRNFVFPRLMGNIRQSLCNKLREYIDMVPQGRQYYLP